MNFCVAIPCYNHSSTLKEVVDALPIDIFKIVVDDGSNPKVETSDKYFLITHEKNLGKAIALKTAFKKAKELGFTHVITLDADTQHSPEFVPNFISCSTQNPTALIAGVRDFSLPHIPEGRRFMNKFSNFWFKFETSFFLEDTQCGFRCYPLDIVENLKISFGSYAYEAEILVKTKWAGYDIIPIKIPTLYTEKSTKESHYNPFWDTLKISLMNAKLSFQALFFPKCLLKKIAHKK